jgi:hypothetical protein
VVEVVVPKEVTNLMMYVPKLDGIGPAYYAAEGSVLDAFNNAIQVINALLN